jgi:hypothetical protein
LVIQENGFRFSSWISPIQFHASLSNLPPARKAGGFVLEKARGEIFRPVTLCRVSALTMGEATRNVLRLQVKQVEAYV